MVAMVEMAVVYPNGGQRRWRSWWCLCFMFMAPPPQSCLPVCHTSCTALQQILLLLHCFLCLMFYISLDHYGVAGCYSSLHCRVCHWQDTLHAAGVYWVQSASCTAQCASGLCTYLLHTGVFGLYCTLNIIHFTSSCTLCTCDTQCRLQCL